MSSGSSEDLSTLWVPSIKQSAAASSGQQCVSVYSIVPKKKGKEKKELFGAVALCEP